MYNWASVPNTWDQRRSTIIVEDGDERIVGRCVYGVLGYMLKEAMIEMLIWKEMLPDFENRVSDIRDNLDLSRVEFDSGGNIKKLALKGEPWIHPIQDDPFGVAKDVGQIVKRYLTNGNRENAE